MLGPRCIRLVLLCLAVEATLAAGWCAGVSCQDTNLQRAEHVPHALRGKASVAARVPREEGSAAVGRTPGWVRGGLAALAVFAVSVSSVPQSVRAQGGNVSVYFGQGCFWHVQNELANAEINLLGRKGSEVTALVGYAGGTEVGGNGEVCYHNNAGAPDYGRMGHTEVVNVVVPEEQLGDFSKVLLDYAAQSPGGRHDPQDRGGEYRSAIGLPGGMAGSAFKQIDQASNGRLQFVEGQGNDGDTVGSKKIWVYDSAKYPFYQGEIYHQFHDDMRDRYPESYHELKKEALKAGKIKRVSCPER